MKKKRGPKKFKNLAPGKAVVVDTRTESLEVIARAGRWHGKEGKFFDATVEDPSMSRAKRARKAGISETLSERLDNDLDFCQDVREYQFIRSKNGYEEVDDALLSIVKFGKNETARVGAARTLYERFDPRFRPKSEVVTTNNFADFMKEVYKANKENDRKAAVVLRPEPLDAEYQVREEEPEEEPVDIQPDDPVETEYNPPPEPSADA